MNLLSTSSYNNKRRLEPSYNLPPGVLSFTITKNDLAEPYCMPGQLVSKYITIGIEWKFEATAAIIHMSRLLPYVQSRTVILKSSDIRTVEGLITVTFILLGSGKQAPCQSQLSQGFIPIGNNTKLLTP